MLTNPVYFYIDEINYKFPGFSKWMDQIDKSFDQPKVITSLKGRDIMDIIVPVGIIAAKEYLSQNFQPKVAFIIDSMSLCFLSVFKFHLKKGQLFNKECLISLLKFVKYYYVEKKVIGAYSKVIVVSARDAEYLEKAFYKNNVLVVSNGVDLPHKHIYSKIFDYTLGILSYWGEYNFRDIEWFLKEYFPKLKKEYPQLKIITAGRGASERIIKKFSDYGINYIGEVNDLFDFFAQIDVYITTVRKESGILNKVLDAFAYNKIVLALDHNMYPFRDLTEGYFTYSTIDECSQKISIIKENPRLVSAMTENAYLFVSSFHNWQNNLSEFKNIIMSQFEVFPE